MFYEIICVLLHHITLLSTIESNIGPLHRLAVTHFRGARANATMKAMDSSSYGRGDNSVTFTTDMDNCMSVNDLQTCAGIGEVPDAANCPPHAAPCCPQWFVMRDLKRRNAKLPAYQQLADSGMEVFTPMIWQIFHVRGKRIRRQVPVVSDLLFVHAVPEALDPIVEDIPTLQYRYQRGMGYRQPMTVRETEMRRFMTAVMAAEAPIYFRPDEITADMYGHRIRIIGGMLDGYECHLLKRRGMRKKRILVELPGLLVAGVEVNPDYIQLL